MTAATDTPTPTKKRYRLLVGSHEEPHPTETLTRYDANGNPVRYPKPVTYQAPPPRANAPLEHYPVIETTNDLLRFNPLDRSMPPKFELLHDAPPPKTKTVFVDVSKFDKMTVPELVQWAEDNEIEVDPKAAKADLVKTIKTAMGV